jgi:D-ribose pyranase
MAPGRPHDRYPMKKVGTLNSHLSRVIASMGHSDKLVVCDCGLPIPRTQVVVDLALTENIPRFTDTLRVVLDELQVESAIIASEMRDHGNGLYEELQAALPGISIREVPHEEFKAIAAADPNAAYVRTGEATPYANVILVSGVTFG